MTRTATVTSPARTGRAIRRFLATAAAFACVAAFPAPPASAQSNGPISEILTRLVQMEQQLLQIEQQIQSQPTFTDFSNLVRDVSLARAQINTNLQEIRNVGNDVAIVSQDTAGLLGVPQALDYVRFFSQTEFPPNSRELIFEAPRGEVFDGTCRVTLNSQRSGNLRIETSEDGATWRLYAAATGGDHFTDILPMTAKAFRFRNSSGSHTPDGGIVAVTCTGLVKKTQ